MSGMLRLSDKGKVHAMEPKNKGLPTTNLGSWYRVTRVFNTVALWAMVLIATIIVVDVVLRVLRIGLPGLFEISGWFLCLVSFFALSYCWVVGGHIRVEILRRRFSTGGKVFIDTLNRIAGIIVFGLIAWGGVLAAINDFNLGTFSFEVTLVRIPLWPPRVFIPIGAGLFCIILLVELLSRRSIGNGSED